MTASEDETARIWDADSGAPLDTLRGHGDWVSSAAFSPDGERVGPRLYDGTARIWDAESGAQLVLARPRRPGRQRRLQPRRRASRDRERDKTARIWDAESGAQLATLRGHRRLCSIAPPSAPTASGW